MSLNEILMLERERVQREKVVMHTIYDRLKNRINNFVRAKSTFCIYTIPEFIPGYPLVLVDKTMVYLINKLRREGFIAEYIDKNNLYVSWDPKAIRDLDAKLRKEEQERNSINKDTYERNEKFIDTLIRFKQ